MLKSYILYDKNHKVIPMSLLKLRKPPQVDLTVVEVTSNICCDTPEAVTQGSGMMAFLGLDSRGNVISGPIVRKNRPKTGRWLQIKYDLCCDEYCSNEAPSAGWYGDEHQFADIGNDHQLEVWTDNEGSPHTRSWYFNGVKLHDGEYGDTTISNTEGTSLEIENIQADFFGEYKFETENCAGKASVTFTIQERVQTLTITEQPQDQELAEEVTFTVEAESTIGSVDYVWAFCHDEVCADITVENWPWPEVTFSGENTNTLVLTGVTEDLVGVLFYVYVFDDQNGLTSNEVTITE